MSDRRDGNWIDDWGACRVCDGEIPHGHSHNCDYWLLEQERDRLRKAAKQMLSTCDEWDRRAIQQGLEGQAAPPRGERWDKSKKELRAALSTANK